MFGGREGPRGRYAASYTHFLNVSQFNKVYFPFFILNIVNSSVMTFLTNENIFMSFSDDFSV